MPSIITATTFSTEFALNLTPKQLFVTDDTDYATPSIPTTGVRTVIEATAPDGTVFYNNTNYNAADIVTNISTTSSIVIALPTNTDGTVVAGIYNLVMSTQIDDGVNPIYVLTKSYNYNFAYIAPTVSINQITDCVSPLFTSTDQTNYVVSGITPTITRTHDLYYPVVISTTPITGSAATITTSTFYSGTQTTVISSVLSYTFSSGFVVTDTVTGNKEAVVDCTFICDLYCCLKTLYNRKENARCTNDILFKQYEAQFEEVMALVQLCLVAIDCNKQADVNTYINLIHIIANCTTDCMCNDGTPTLVQGLGGGSGISVVVSSNAGIGVTPVTVGDTTTYTLTFNTTLLSKLNASYNTVVASADNSIIITPTTVGDTTTYDLAANVPASQNRSEFRCLIEYSNPSSPAVSITNSDFLTSGSNMQSATVESEGYSGNPNWANINNLFKVSDFQVSANNTYKIQLRSVVTGYSYIDQNIAVPVDTARLSVASGILTCEWVRVESGEFYFKFLQNGITITNKNMCQFTGIIVSIYISD